MNKQARTHLRNIAIVAHVDHGKTTLVDRLLQFSGTTAAGADRVMDSGDIERERGITILAKNTGVRYQDYHINIVDTPGHSDFGGEVERTLQMVEGFLLLVDAAEGVLPGTRFVLSKALALGLQPIVLINKIDRPDAAIEQTEEAIHDLFLDLAQDESQLEFPVLYGSSKHGYITTDATKRSGDMQPLFDAIIAHVPAPTSTDNHPLQILITNVSHSDYLGPIAIGRVFEGTLSVGDAMVVTNGSYVSKQAKATKLFTFLGLDKTEQATVFPGDIVAITGFVDEPKIGMTICTADKMAPLEYVAIDEPTMSMFFGVNTSPFSGREGNLLTSRQIKERLEKELKTNVALRVEPTESSDVFKVAGRGQLHLSILIESMRREGFELQVSAPQIINKTVNGTLCEPIENVIIDIPQEFQGVVIEKLGLRKGILTNITPLSGGRVRLELEVPSRGLIGFRSQFLVDTRGFGILNMSLKGYEPYKGDLATRTKGALVSMEKGKASAYALDMLQPRGTLFVGPGEEIYAGMIVGEHSRSNDLDVNPCKEKKLTNMRASGSDDATQLAPKKAMDLEMCIEWIQPDELIEVTPKAVRLRKKVLQASMRKKK